VLTVPSLKGQSLEDYSLTVLRQWGIGDQEKNNGVLLLVAVQDRKSRIEVGYGLEGALPDGLTGRIQDQYMLPYFRSNDYDKGILNGYSALLQTVLKEYNLTTKDLDVQGAQPAKTDPGGEISPLTLGIRLGGLPDSVFYSTGSSWAEPCSGSCSTASSSVAAAAEVAVLEEEVSEAAASAAGPAEVAVPVGAGKKM
jgi:uncharacterized membrane protein YgcG